MDYEWTRRDEAAGIDGVTAAEYEAGLWGKLENLVELLKSGAYLFCNRERNLLKALWWERNGFWLNQKRLEKDWFPWPGTGGAARELSGEELTMLLSGIDFFKAHKPVYYKKVS
jgi:hypothetical protein